jgi:hypothetical protein
MTTPKEALRPFAACVFNDNGDITIDTSHLRTEDYMRAKSALASLQGEAVERTIKAALIAADCDSGDGSYIHCSVEKVVRAILATGLVPDEAAIRADNTANLISIIADIREKTGLGGKPMLNELADAIAAEMDRRVADERERCASEAFTAIISTLITDDGNSTYADHIAAAIRSGGVK